MLYVAMQFYTCAELGFGGKDGLIYSGQLLQGSDCVLMSSRKCVSSVVLSAV